MQGTKNQWQVVGKAKKTPTPAKPKADQGQSTTNTASVSIDPAFAVLDREWNAKKLAETQRSTLSDALTDSTDDDGEFDLQHKPTAIPNNKKRRAPKPKKPKVAEVAAQVIAELQAALDAMESKYPSNASRAEALAAYMHRTFEPCELAFNKLLLSDPQRAAFEPLKQLDEAFARPIRALLQSIPLADAGLLTVSLLDAIVQGQPDTLGGATPPKAQVGILLTMALLAQAHPSALLVASAHIQQGGLKYTSSGRVALLLWTLDQFALASMPACAASYSRIVLPQLLAATTGAPGPRLQPEAYAALSSYAQRTLLPVDTALAAAAPMGVVDAHGHAAAIIPVDLYESLQRGVAASQNAALQQQLPLWRAIVAASAPVADVLLLVRVSLDAAASAVARDGQQAPLVPAVAATVVACCAAHPPCFDAWIGRHKHALRGSAAVLVHLAAHPALHAPLRTSRATAARFSATLEMLQARHQQQLAAGKGWQGSAAASADTACRALLGSRGVAGRVHDNPVGLLFCVLLLVLPIAAVLLRHDARVRDLAVQWLGPGALARGDRAFDSVLRLLELHVQRLWVMSKPHVQAVWATAVPHVQHVRAMVERHVKKLLVLAGPTIG